MIGLLSHAITMASFSSELSLLIGLGVGVDYALFIVTRYRQGLLRGLASEEAVVDALDTSGRAVMFAGHDRLHRAARHVRARRQLPLRRRRSRPASSSRFTVIAALTLLPALLGFIGPRVLGRRARRQLAERGELSDSDESPAWSRWAGSAAARARRCSPLAPPSCCS